MTYLKLTKDESQTLDKMASLLSVPADWLYHLIDFESLWNPLARNPLSGARGLIQFTHSTAKSLGYSDADNLVALNPSIIDQLDDPVFRYLRQFAPFKSEQSLLMAVFYPAFRYVDTTTEFPPEVQKQNPGIVRVSDYMMKVFPNWIPPIAIVGGAAIIIIAAIIIYSQKGV